MTVFYSDIRMYMDTFYVGAAEHTSWPLTLDDVERHLKHRFPNIVVVRGQGLITGNFHLLFCVPADGEDVECMYVEQSHLIIKDCTPRTCADILDWFLPLLSAGTPCVALVDSHPVPVPLPPVTGDALAGFLTTLSECDGLHPPL